MDRIANEGIRFTQGFCTAATSTPSRYSVMTGRYPWTNPDAKILPGNAKLIIDTEAITLPKVMKQAGYITGSVGKWHIGLGDGNVDWNKRVYPGASEIGYDYSFIQAATNDRVPCVFLENNKVIGLEAEDPLYVDYRKNFPGEPTGKDNPELLRMHPSVGHAGSIVNGVPRIGFQKGGKAAQWRDEDMAQLFLQKAKQFVVDNKERPFFLYYGLHQPHVPRVPNERFIGKSGMGPRGDVILEADWCVDEFLKELCEKHISGQLRVAPEHVSDNVLKMMGKPKNSVYESFIARYQKVNARTGKKQFVVPYLMSSHPGSTLKEAVELAEYVRDIGYMPEQVQDFYPTPSTISTCMYYTGFDPRTGERVYVPKSASEKAMQRALMQYFMPQYRDLARTALQKAGREDLIGFGKHALVPPRMGKQAADTPQECRKRNENLHGKHRNLSLIHI